MAADFAARFVTLRDALAAFYRTRAAEGGAAAAMLREVAAGVAGLQPPPRPERPGRLPGCRHVAAAMAAARRGPLAAVAEAFDALEPDMRWVQSSHYRASLGDDYMANYAYTQLAGTKDALAFHDRMATGFFVIGPGWHYPDHHHEAEEIYVPFCGDTLWSQAGGPLAPREPGATIHNPPWQRHEMRTLETPLFALYCWRGPVGDEAQLVA